MEQIRQLRESGRTVLITSHDPVVFDSPVVERVIELCDGRVVGD
jgi:putative ABC transport system ATP-binding protein